VATNLFSDAVTNSENLRIYIGILSEIREIRKKLDAQYLKLVTDMSRGATDFS